VEIPFHQAVPIVATGLRRARPARRTSAAVAIVLASVALAMSGCGGPMHALDAEAARVIARRQGMALGQDATNDPYLNPPTTVDPEAGRQIYDYRPGTRNPGSRDLPATVAPRRQGELEAPEMLDPTDNAVEMNLQEILGYAIANSREYRNRKEELFLAALDLLAERHLWGPRFFHNLTANFSGTAEGGDHDHVSDLVNEFRVTQRLPYGGEVSVAALVNLVNVLQNESGLTPEQSQDAELVVGATLPLLRGAGMVAREDIIQTERNLVYATRSFERFRREFFVDIAVDYFRLMAQAERIVNLKMQFEGLDQLARRFEALAAAGREPYFRAEDAQANAQFALNDVTNAQEGYAASLDSFKIRLGMPVTQALAIQPMEIEVPEPVLDTVRSVQVAREYRLDLQTSADLIDDARRQVKIAKNALLPDLELFADVRVPTDPDLDEGGLQFSFEDSRYDAGVRFGSPLDRRIEWIGYRRSLIGLERTHRSYTLAADQVAQDVRSAIRQIRQARFTLELQERNVVLAERRKKGVELREGELLPRDVIEAEEDLLEARNRRDDAQRDLRISVLNYLLQSGQMRVGPDGRWNPPARLVPLAAPEQDGAGENGAADAEKAIAPPAVGENGANAGVAP